jgi:hypothetical protein
MQELSLLHFRTRPDSMPSDQARRGWECLSLGFYQAF